MSGTINTTIAATEVLSTGACQGSPDGKPTKATPIHFYDKPQALRLPVYATPETHVRHPRDAWHHTPNPQGGDHAHDAMSGVARCLDMR
jgi:hypothetical protein